MIPGNFDVSEESKKIYAGKFTCKVILWSIIHRCLKSLWVHFFGKKTRLVISRTTFDRTIALSTEADED